MGNSPLPSLPGVSTTPFEDRTNGIPSLMARAMSIKMSTLELDRIPVRGRQTRVRSMSWKPASLKLEHDSWESGEDEEIRTTYDSLVTWPTGSEMDMVPRHA